MFGLVKVKKCSLNNKDRLEYDSLYCGSCKSIGCLYGHIPRFYLNSDIVFLAGILKDSNLLDNSGENRISRNCFALPNSPTIPLYLQFAAYANVILAYMNLVDKTLDENNTVKKYFYSMLKLIHEKKLNIIQQDLCEFKELMQEQLKREKEKIPEHLGSLINRLEYFSEVTENMMFLILNKFNLKQNKNLSLIFQKFCRLLYVLDALEDFSDDYKSKCFNALSASFETEILEQHQRDIITDYLKNLCFEINQHLKMILLSEEKIKFYHNQLYNNLIQRLNFKGSVCCKSNSKIISWRLKWKLAFSSLESKYGKIQYKNTFIIQARRLISSVMLMLIPYPVWAASTGEKPGVCAECMASACLLYCCCTKGGRSCLINLCGGAALSCCCCSRSL